ncbi:MAG: 6-phosphofructokinase [Eubacteriaceae bacterium]|nr:6-phosphofructokinase [Eubacteriaceae bacterium]
MGTIGLLTSGGDSPGMNAALRAATRKAIYEKQTVIGIKSGFKGLLESDMSQLTVYSVADIIHRGGTFLYTARSDEMKTEQGIKKAVSVIKGSSIDCLIAIGGDGTYKGAHALSQQGVNVIALPATIDNDVASTEYSIGFDTAVNTASDALSRIRDSSYSNDRIDVIEVMGRASGNIALFTGISGGAEAIVVPEAEVELEKIAQKIARGKMRGKLHTIIVFAEGAGDLDEFCSSIERKVAQEINEQVIIRTTRLGYIQRGGSPSGFDRVLASRMGHYAVEAYLAGKSNIAVCYANGKYADMPLEAAINMPYSFNSDLYALAMELSI